MSSTSLWKDLTREVQTTLGRRRSSGAVPTRVLRAPAGVQGLVVEEDKDGDGWDVVERRSTRQEPSMPMERISLASSGYLVGGEEGAADEEDAEYRRIWDLPEPPVRHIAATSASAHGAQAAAPASGDETACVSTRTMEQHAGVPSPRDPATPGSAAIATLYQPDQPSAALAAAMAASMYETAISEAPMESPSEPAQHWTAEPGGTHSSAASRPTTSQHDDHRLTQPLSAPPHGAAASHTPEPSSARSDRARAAAPAVSAEAAGQSTAASSSTSSHSERPGSAREGRTRSCVA